MPFVRPLVKLAATAGATAEIPSLIDDAWDVMRCDHPGPAFLDFLLDVVFMEAEEPERPEPRAVARPHADAAALSRAAALLQGADRPVIMAGTNLYWGHGGSGRCVSSRRRPGCLCSWNGLARAACPPTTPTSSRARSAGLKGADVALVVGVPMDLPGFGAAFGEETEIVAVDLAEPERDHPRAVAAECYGDIAETLGALAGARGGDTTAWLEHLRGVERSKREAEREQLTDERAPLHPMRVYGEPAQVLDRDVIVVGDGGDFVSYAGRVVASYEPGCWLDPGPFGCLGSGPGYALAVAKLAHPDRQVVLLLGDGAFKFSGMEFDTSPATGSASSA